MTVVRAAELDLTYADISHAASLFGINTTEPLGGFENATTREEAVSQARSAGLLATKTA